ncbi:Dynein light chain 1 [Durusdinium trenchii]|uniref:Axonemal n=1 Tax=Durusdinium trenchii TaxID=1381693 RepID=A0ABP0SRU9_9DINO
MPRARRTFVTSRSADSDGDLFRRASREKFTEAQSLLDPLAELWSAAAEFLEVLRFCGEADLWSFDQELCCSKCKDMSEQLEDMLPICMCVELHTRCELLLEILNLAQIFKSQELQEVHWQQLDAMVDKWNLKILQNLRTRLNNKSVMLQDTGPNRHPGPAGEIPLPAHAVCFHVKKWEDLLGNFVGD